ncbi:hypothetical protein ACO0KZ_04540 [Undibacterium sp. Di24W]
MALLSGMTVSHVWLGIGSALFLELGTLSEGNKRKDGSLGNSIGEVTVMVDFDWRVERQRSILGGSHDTPKRRISISNLLLNTTIVSAQTVGRIPELQMQLSNKLWISTFSHDKGQPTWAVGFNSLGLGWLCVERGKLCVDRRNS